MNPLDRTLIPLYNRFAHHSRYVDDLLGNFANNDLVKGGVVLAVFWGLWFAGPRSHDRSEARATLLATLVAAVVAVGGARALTLVLPFRARPLFVGDPFTRQPYDVQVYLSALPRWSSFPSDHAALFFALATGCFLVSRRVGGALLAYVSVFIIGPRLYLGIHYPTDILAGGAIGAACAVGAIAAQRGISPLRRLAAHALALGDRYPLVSYAGLFVACYEIATLFNHVRSLVKVVAGRR